MPLPLLQKRQADLVEACGFPCAPDGEHEFGGQMLEMWRPTGERKPARASLIGYGGAAFGGKSYGMVALGRIAAEIWPGVKILYLRRTFTQLSGPASPMELADELYTGVAQDRNGGKEWKWTNGSMFFFGHVQHEKNKHDYQSKGPEILLVDEATGFTWSIIDYLLSRMRVSSELGDFAPFAVLGTNPGNIGHAWYAQVFDIDLNKHTLEGHEQVKRVRNPNGKYSEVYFIPAYLEDNQIGVIRDPGYEHRLEERDPSIARALRHGDWSIFAGQMFPLWMRERITCAPFDIPRHWPRWRATDYGSSHAWACGWATMDPDTKRIYIYRAIKETGLTDRQQARIIKQMTPPDEHISATYAGHDHWASTGKGVETVTDSAQEFAKEGIHLTKADIDRVNGVRKIQRLLVDLVDEKPGIQIFEPYYDVFDCMVSLVRDEHNPEDVKKVDGDDAFDMLKYLLTNTNPAPVTRNSAESTKVNLRRFSRWTG